MFAPKCSTYNDRPTFANPMYLKKAQAEKPCLYEILYDTSDLANIFTLDWEETMTLEKESRSKLDKDLLKPYDYTKQNSLYEIFKPPSQENLDQLARAKEVRKKMWRKSFVRSKPNIVKNITFLPVSKSVSKSRQAYNDMTNNINHFRDIFDKSWEKHTYDRFRTPTALDMEVLIKTCLMPLSIKTQNDSFRFVHKLKQEMHEDFKYVESLEKEIDELESDKSDFSNIYDLLLQECVSKDVMCSYLHYLTDLDAYTELQCLYLHKVKECEYLAEKLSKQTESVNEKVYNELSQSFAKLEKHSISLKLDLQNCKEKLKNDTVWKENESNVFLKEREQYHEIQQTLNVNAVCVNCGKCVFNSNHDACVSKYLKDMNARTKKPKEVPISARKPNNKVNKSVAAPHKKTIVQLVLFIVDSRYTKHMAGNLKLLCNFIEKFLGTVHFRNDQFAPILGYGDLIQGNIMIKLVYYVEGLNHNLFSVGQFCDADLEVAFWKSTCYVRDLQGNDLLTSNRRSDLYTISLQETTSSTPIWFMAKPSPTQAWLWHRRLSHLNFDYINLLSKKDVMIGLPKLKYVKDQLCSSCEDETPEVLKDFLKMIQRNLQAQAITVWTERGTKFLNKTLHAYFKEEVIEHQTSTPRTPEQNGIVERQNHTLVEAARTMLSASKLPLFFWANAIATT
ncbi:retrovirus-related pol polyprotein from transposon TNT 1-94 [Tanacetum coccineum]